MEQARTARRLGIASATATAVLLVAYALTLAIGLATLESPDQPIGEPMFTILEVLILAMMPAMVALMTAVHAAAPPSSRPYALLAVAFMAAVAVVTSVVHILVLTLSRQPEFAGPPWQPLVFSFRWPSVVYALDILAWDVFFAFSMFAAAPVFGGSRLARTIRVLMIVSGMLSLAGLAGAFAGDMQLRNIGIVGYVGVFLGITVLLRVFFRRSQPLSS